MLMGKKSILGKMLFVISISKLTETARSCDEVRGAYSDRLLVRHCFNPIPYFAYQLHIQPTATTAHINFEFKRRQQHHQSIRITPLSHQHCIASPMLLNCHFLLLTCYPLHFATYIIHSAPIPFLHLLYVNCIIVN